jgi:hypothetical protein
MADLATFRAKTATFDSLALTGLQDVSINGQSTAEDVQSDADPIIKGTVVDGIADDIAVTIEDLTHAADAKLEIGDCASLVVVFEKRASGRAAAGSGNKTGTWANAVLTGKAPRAGTGGRSACVLTFRAPACVWS